MIISTSAGYNEHFMVRYFPCFSTLILTSALYIQRFMELNLKFKMRLVVLMTLLLLLTAGWLQQGVQACPQKVSRESTGEFIGGETL